VLFTNDMAVWLASLPGMTAYFPATPAVSADGRYVTCDGGSLPITFDGYMLNNDSGPRIEMRAGGLGPTQGERTIDVDSLSLLIYGPSDDHNGAEHLVRDIDQAVMSLVCPLNVPSQSGGPSTRIIDFDYAGGPPRYVSRDHASIGARDIFSAEYALKVARVTF
jgi:hypothetical protein